MRNNKILVIDSSVALKWLYTTNEKHITQADLIIKKTQGNGTGLIMPELAHYEIGNALVYKDLELPILLRLIERFYVLPIQFIPEDIDLAQLTIELAYNNKITYYDASFLALAKKFSADLVTDNPKHQIQKVYGVKVVLLKNYR